MNSNEWRSATRWVWFAFWLGLLSYEITVLLVGEKSALLTPVGISFLEKHLWAGYTLGGLFAHFVLLRRPWMPWPPPPSWGLWVVFTSLGAMLGADYLLGWVWPVEASAGAGVLVGHFFWAQKGEGSATDTPAATTEPPAPSSP